MFDHERADDLPVAPSDLDDRGWVQSAAPGTAAHAPSTTRRGPRSGPRRPAWLRQRAVVVTVAVVATALVAGLFAWNGGRLADGVADASQPVASDVAVGSGGPTASGRPGPSASAQPSQGYEPLTGISPAPTALLTARGASGVVVPLDASFRLESTDGTPASTLAAGLTVEPAFSFTVNKVAGDHAVEVAPARPLEAGTIYRFALRGGSGQLLDTWAFQAAQPLRIVGTLPETRSADVPLDTGIEVTFDQDGVADAESHFSIRPATNGRFEQHGRTLAFVPDRPLTPSTLFSVTVTRGIKVTDTGEATVVDTRFQFETRAEGVSADNPRTFEFSDAVVESATAERPTIGIWSYGGADKPPTSIGIVVYRFGGIDAAIDAFRTIRARPDWTRWSSTGLVDATGLTRVVSADLALNPYRNGFWVQLPDRLPAGWYLVQQSDGSKPIQTVLQVTDVAGYLAVSDTKTLVWANDLHSKAPLVGATVASDGVRFGRTDGHGLAIGTTPRSLLPTTGATCAHPCDPVVVVRTTDGRRVFLPAAAGRDKLEGYGDIYWWSETDARTWSLLHTDRSRYRSGDTVHVWGFARDRDSGAAPATITIRLYGESGDGTDTGAPAVATLVRHPDAAGAINGSLPLAGLPDAYYTLTMSIGSRVIGTTSFAVGPIAKPAYQLDVTTGRRVYIAGDRVKVTVDARFFEGTPVPGVPLRIDGFATDGTFGNATTDALGTAVWRTIAAIDPEQGNEGPNVTTIDAIPARAEEAEITAGSRDVVVFPSSRTIDAVGRIANGKVIVTGGVHVVALNRLEAAIAAGSSIWDLDARGAAVRGATVTVSFIELIPKRHQVGTEYDFVEKKVVPVYETEIIEHTAGTVRVTTAANGSWTASVPASVADHEYRIVATVGDPDGHVARITSYASRQVGSPYETNPLASLAPTTPTANPDDQFSVGERIDLKLTDPDRPQTVGDGSRYLFFTAQRGIHTAVVQASRRYVTTFPAWGPPNLSIGGVRFTGDGYVGTAWFGAGFHAADRQLQVDLSTVADRYAPGGTVKVNVRTRSASGAPVAATVILRAVDEKLFAIGAAAAEDPLNELYSGIGSGMVGTYRSHRDPQGQPEGGDTTGGGGDDRDDFRDSLLFEAITTGADGRGSTTFKLSDDLTSWRVTAAAVTRRLQAGVGSVLVPVGLPFFVDASIAPEYLLADRPTIAVRTFGSAVAAGTPVTIRVSSASLGFDSGPLPAKAFVNIDVPLPALRSGTQTLTITATTGAGATARTDRLTRTFSVVATRLTRQRTNYVELPSSAAFVGGDGFTSVVIADASGGRYISLLSDLAAGGGARLDRALAADLASKLLKDRFGSEPTDGSVEPFAPGRYQGEDDGLAIVPYGSSDLELSAMVAIVAPDRVDRAKLAYYLRTIRENTTETRERRTYALAGLAGLGDPVLRDVRAAIADPDLTIREQLMLGLGAASLGDSAIARTILRTVAAAVGEQSGTLARLRVGSSAADVTAGTALAAVLAAAVGDPLAARFWAYVEANPAADRIEVLPAIAFVTHTLDRLPVQPAKVAWTVDGTRHVVDLATGGSIRLSLTAAQLASLSIDRLAGTVGVTTLWREAVQPAAFHPDPDLTITRSIQPADPVHASDLVVVDLHVTFNTSAANGCRQVTELVPSGLAPVGAWSHWTDPDAEVDPATADVILPYD
ncbi:MAG TPA: Ig-like domain-containing protein, partial [Candidatus Limnocylindrales bacterium]|nr:Ig-like domain-containing protein [Candidatus Limnocylindrales bacterium]